MRLGRGVPSNANPSSTLTSPSLSKVQSSWRDTLKQGDWVDVQTKNGHWYKAIVIDDRDEHVRISLEGQDLGFLLTVFRL